MYVLLKSCDFEASLAVFCLPLLERRFEWMESAGGVDVESLNFFDPREKPDASVLISSRSLLSRSVDFKMSKFC